MLDFGNCGSCVNVDCRHYKFALAAFRVKLCVRKCVYVFRFWLRKQTLLMKLIGSLIGIFFLSFFLVMPSFADEEIICKVKGVGQRIFLLDSGIFSSKVLVKKPKGEFADWCPETESQKPSFGRGTAICKLSGVRLQNKLVWGETVIDFVKPSWKRRYRFAKLGQSWKQSQPGGRETAFCKHR